MPSRVRAAALAAAFSWGFAAGLEGAPGMPATPTLVPVPS